jgi:hypothetical protein
MSAPFFISYCLGNIAGPFVFKASETPVYTSGIIAVLVSYNALALLLVAFPFYASRQNNIKADLLVVLDGQDEGVLDVFGNKTDGDIYIIVILTSHGLTGFF